MPNIGPMEIGIVLVIALIVFGPKRVPDLGRSLGKGIREFKGSIGGADDEAVETPQPTAEGRREHRYAAAEGRRQRDHHRRGPVAQEVKRGPEGRESSPPGRRLNPESTRREKDRGASPWVRTVPNNIEPIPRLR